jgi:hypothetical protein
VCAPFTKPKASKQFITTEGTATADNVLEACTVCSGDKYASAKCTDSADTECTLRTAATVGETYIKKQGNATVDNEIGTCKTCGDGEWMNVTCTADRDAMCSKFTQPEEGKKFIKTGGSVTADNELEECSTCQPDIQFVETNCTANADTVCKACKSCAATEYQKAACSSTKDTKCVAAPTYSKLTVKTGKNCQMANGSAITSAEYTSNSEWKFSFQSDGGDAMTSGGTVVAPCADDTCDKKDGVMDSQQSVSAGNLVVPKTVIITAAAGAVDSWCIASLCVSSTAAGAKAYKWSGNQWMNPSSSGPDAGAATSWTKQLVAADSCDAEASTDASADATTDRDSDSDSARSELADTSENTEASANGIHVGVAKKELNAIQAQIDNVGDYI